MNPLRPNALSVTWIWRPALLYSLLALQCAPLQAATRKAAQKPHAQQPSPSPAATPAPTPVPTPPPAAGGPGGDLQLRPEEERRAASIADFIQGTIAEENADVDQALQYYRKVLAVDPTAKIRSDDGDDSLTLLSARVGFELAQRGDPAAAIDLLKDTIKASPKDPMAYYVLSQLYSKSLKKYDVALKYAEQALDLDQKELTYYIAIYDLQLNLNQPQKAAEILDRASKLQTDDAQYWLKLSELYLRSSVKDNAPVAPEDMKKLNELFQKTVALSKNNPYILSKVADFNVLTRQVKEAIPLYQKVIELKQDVPDQALSNIREKLAESFAVTGQRDDAIKVLQDLVKSNPQSYSTYERLGKLFLEKQDFANALEDYQQILRLNPKNWKNYLTVMSLMLELKKNDQAVALMSDAHKKFADIPRVTYWYAMALSGAKKNQEAMAIFEQTITEAQNSDSNLLDGQFYFSYGAAAEQANLIQKASELFKKTIALDPSGKSLPSPGAAYNYLGYMWVDHDQNVDEGGELIKRALEMEPDNPAYLDSLGWYYYKKGETDKALVELLKAAEATKPEDATVFEHIGDTYQKLGKAAEATSYWKKSIALDPDNKKVSEKLEGTKPKVTELPTPESDKKPDTGTK